MQCLDKPYRQAVAMGSESSLNHNVLLWIVKDSDGLNRVGGHFTLDLD
jgi:hypothetical protein